MACVLLPAFSGPARADCQPNPPASGDTVTCTGPAPTTVPVIAPAATNVTLNINSDATLTGGGLIFLGTGALITNNGTVQVISPASVGILVDANSIVRNFGTIATSAFNALSAASVGDNAVLRNEQGGQINISGDLAAGLLIGGGNNSTLINAGRIALNTFQGGGLFAQEGSGHILTNTATGVIESNLDQAFGINGQRGLAPGAGSNFQLLNEGTIVTRGQASHGMLMNQLTNSSAINSGSITTSGGSSETVNRAFGIFSFEGQGNTLLNTGSGVINASGLGSSGMEMFNGSGNLLRNEGTINVSGAGAHGIYVLSGSGNTLDNRGSLNITGVRGNGLRADDGSNTLLNSGSVLVQGRDAFGVFMQGTNNTLVNTGTIRATGANADGVVSNTVAGSFVVTIENSGSLISEQRFAVRGVNGQETVINSGLIRSDAGTAIDLRAGADSLILRTGSQIVGLADGGTGIDRVVLEGSGAATNNFQNFETLRMTGVDWTWSGSGIFVDTHIESGALRIASGGTLSTATVNMSGGTTLEVNGTLDRAGGLMTNVVGSAGSETVIVNGLMNATVNLMGGSDTLNWNGGVIAGGFNLGADNDFATLRNLTPANLVAGIPIDGGLGVDRLVWDNTAGSGVARLLNWEAIDLINASQLTFASTLTLGDAGTGTGTLSIDSTSTVFAGQGAHEIVPFSAGQFVTVTNAGMIDLTNGPSAATDSLTVVGNYIGAGGRLLLQTVLGADNSPSDRLVISGGAATGTTGIGVTNLGGTGALTIGNGIPVVQAINGATTAGGAFSLNQRVAAGAFEYLLYRGGVTADSVQSWYLRSTAPPVPPDPTVPVPQLAAQPALIPPPPGPPAPGVPTIATPDGPVVPLIRPEVALHAELPAMTRQLGLSTLGTFHERHGEQGLLNNAGNFSAVWGRLFGAKHEQSWTGMALPSFDGYVWGLQTGLDLVSVRRPSGHSDHIGLFYGYAEGRGDVSGFAVGRRDVAVGDMRLHSNSAGAYWTHIGPSGWYLDAVLMYSAVSTATRSTAWISSGSSGSAFTGSVEGGYPFALGGGWTLEPQAQLIWQYLSLDDTQDPFSTIAYNTPDALTGRFGARLQGSFQSGQALIKPYLKVNLWHTFAGSDAVVFGATPVVNHFGSAFVELGGGVAAQLTKAVGVHATVNYLTNVDDDRRESIGGNVGMRVSW